MIQDQWEDYDRISTPEHTLRVSDEIAAQFPAYWERYTGANPAVQAQKLFGGAVAVRIQSPAPTRSAPVRSSRAASRTTARSSSTATYVPMASYPQRLCEALEKHEEAHAAARQFLNPECMEEWAGDLAGFARMAGGKIEVLRRALYSSREDLEAWQRRFRDACRRRPDAIFTVFSNLVALAADRARAVTPQEYAAWDTPQAFGLQNLDDGVVGQDAPRTPGQKLTRHGMAEEGPFHVLRVLNLGLTSAVLQALAPAFFPRRSSHALAALYFLTNKRADWLPSQTSEFQFIRPEKGVLQMSANIYYPYSIFVLHANRLACAIQRELDAPGQPGFDPARRFVFVTDFLDFVAQCNETEIRDWKTPHES